MARRPTSIDPVSEWLESGRQLRVGLESERKTLLERLKEIDAALVRLAAADSNFEIPRVEPTPDVGTKTLSDLILAAVAAHPNGASLGDVRDWLQRAGKRFEPKHLPSYVWKLRSMKLVVAKGKKGSMTYFLAPASTKEVA